MSHRSLTMIARQLWPYEEPTTPGEIPDHEYLEIVDRRPKTSDNGQQISMPLYNHLNSLVHVNKKDMKIKRQKLILCFMLGCVFSASIMAPLIFIFREPHLVLNKEKYDFCNTHFHSPCKNNGKCLMYNNTPVCVCKAGFIGPFCEIKDLCITKHPCHNEGRCITTSNSSYCLCYDGYLGRHCQHRGPQGHHFLLAFNARHRNITLYINSQRHGICDIVMPSDSSIPFKTIQLYGSFITYHISNVRKLAVNREEDISIRVICEVPAYLYYFVTDAYGSIWASLPVPPIGTLSYSYVIPQYQLNQKFDALAVMTFKINTTITINFDRARWVLSNVTFEDNTYVQDTITFTAERYKYSYFSCSECLLTGTHVSGTDSFALFYKTYIPEVNPVLPTKDFSKIFIIPEMPENITVLGYRIFSQHNTTINVQGVRGSTSTLNLNAGHFLVTNNKQTTAVICDKDAILFLKIYSPHTGTYAPHIAGIDQYLPYYQFVVPFNTRNNYATFIVPESDIDDIKLNGNHVSQINIRTINKESLKLNSTMSFLIFSIPLEIGWHKVENINQNSFGLIISGISNPGDQKHFTNYAYFAGMSYKPW